MEILVPFGWRREVTSREVWVGEGVGVYRMETECGYALSRFVAETEKWNGSWRRFEVR